VFPSFEEPVQNLVLNVNEGGPAGSGIDAPFVRIDCLELGLTADGCDGGGDGDIDDLDGLSYGIDFQPAGQPAVNFSVAPGSIGLVGTAVRAQTQCPPGNPGLSPEPEPDEFASVMDGANTIVLDGNGPIGSCTPGQGFPLSLTEGPSSRDDLDALDANDPTLVDANFDGTPEDPVYFSLASGSPSLGANNAADILRTVNGGAPTVFATRAALGLEAGDDVDAFCLKESGNGTYSAVDDTILFSLVPGSPTLAQIGAGGGDLLSPNPANPTILATETQLGLEAADDVDAMKCSQLKDCEGDTDNDGILNCVDTDDDNDGCSDVQEGGPSEVQGGKRNAHHFWDFYDVWTGAGPIKDYSVASSDIFQVISRFNTTGNPGGDPLTPAPPSGYHTSYDRGPVVGPYPWSLGAPNGSIAATDVFAVIVQFGHAC
jgi:hypothetical protein